MQNFLIKISKDQYINITKNEINVENENLYFYYNKKKYIVKNMLKVVGKNLEEWDVLLSDGSIRTIPVQFIFEADNI